MLSFCYNWCCHVELLFMIINVVIFQFVVYAAALWSALHGLVGVLDVQICNNMINIQAGYLKYKYKYKWLYKYNILLPPLKLETLFILFLNSFGSKRLLCLIMLNCKSLPFFYFLTFEKGRLLYIHPVGWLVGRLVGWSVDVTINFFNI